MAQPIRHGDIDGIEPGHHFHTRKEMTVDAFHRVLQAGIDGNGKEGSASIVLSGGYEDDEDFGSEIVYTGHGGNDPNTKKQVQDQSWASSGNAGLALSSDLGLPVRVTRGFQHKTPFSPNEGYTYAGLFFVEEYWQERGKSGFLVCRFRLRACSSFEFPNVTDADTSRLPLRKETTVSRVVRDSAVTREIKELYNNTCQVCGTRVKTMAGVYSEGAHIRALGRPHNGEDTVQNMLCLCPNHHASFDKGGFSIADDFGLLGAENGTLTVAPTHNLNISNFAYHRSCHGLD